jgi:hypothetical protein
VLGRVAVAGDHPHSRPPMTRRRRRRGVGSWRQDGHAAPVGVAAAGEAWQRASSRPCGGTGPPCRSRCSRAAGSTGRGRRGTRPGSWHRGAGFSASHWARPRWSGWQWVTMIRVTGLPRRRGWLPGVGGVEAVAGVDDRHALAVLDQPQVDVVEGEGQGIRIQCTPGATQGLAGCGRVSKGYSSCGVICSSFCLAVLAGARCRPGEI